MLPFIFNATLNTSTNHLAVNFNKSIRNCFFSIFSAWTCRQDLSIHLTRKKSGVFGLVTVIAIQLLHIVLSISAREKKRRYFYRTLYVSDLNNPKSIDKTKNTIQSFNQSTTRARNSYLQPWCLIIAIIVDNVVYHPPSISSQCIDLLKNWLRFCLVLTDRAFLVRLEMPGEKLLPA